MNIKSNLYKLYEDHVQITEGRPGFHIETQLLLEVSAKRYLADKPADERADLFLLVFKG